ncbi:hypothetical protein, partial [Streptococcus acidominimus]
TDFSEQMTAQDILKALGSLLERVQRGEVSQEQANRESTILANLLKAFDAVELQEKLAMVESVLKSRS